MLIAERHKYPDSIPYRRILEFLMSPQQAELATEMPATIEELAQRLGRGVATLQQEADSLFKRGVVSMDTKKQPVQYKVASFTAMFYTLCAYSPESPEGQRLRELWDDFCLADWYPRLASEMAEQAQPMERVVPAYRAVRDVPGLHPLEDMRELLKAQSVIALVNCTCRLQAKKCHSALDTCFIFGDWAETTLAQAMSRRLSYDEALALMDKAEEEGQVHTWMNSTFLYPRFQCNCCSCCCVMWVPLRLYGVPVGKRWAKSRFQSQVNQALCQGCPICVDRCQFQAITMQPVPGSPTPKAVVDPEKCWGCGLCVLKCQPGALSMKLVRPLEHIPGLAPA